MSTPLANDVVRRVKHETPLYKIVHVSLLPGEPEKFEVSVRNPRQDEVQKKFTLEEALRILCPEFYESAEEETVEETPGKPNRKSREEPKEPKGVVDCHDLASSVMVDGRLTIEEKAKFWKIVREVQTGNWPGTEFPKARDMEN